MLRYLPILIQIQIQIQIQKKNLAHWFIRTIRIPQAIADRLIFYVWRRMEPS